MKIFRAADSKKTLLVSLTLAGLVGFCRASALAQTVPIDLVCGGNLDFGTIATGPGGGTVTIRPSGSGSRITSGNVSVLSGALMIPVCGVFMGSHSSAQISVATATIQVVSGANNMNVNGFNVKSDANGPVYMGTSLGDIQIGATLHVSGTQAAGSYTGTFTVTATGF